MTVLYLHIGMHKTGSTSIQTVFHAERETLARHGVGYLGFAENHSRLFEAIFREGTEAARLTPAIRRRYGIRDRISDADRARLLSDVVEDISASAAPKFVVSGEGLCRLGRSGASGMRRSVEACQPHPRHRLCARASGPRQQPGAAACEKGSHYAQHHA